MTSNQGALPPSRYQSNFWKQLSCLSARLMRNAYRHPFLISLNLLASLVMAVAVAIIFYDTGASDKPLPNSRVC